VFPTHGSEGIIDKLPIKMDDGSESLQENYQTAI
jgi:hypothetical protein